MSKLIFAVILLALIVLAISFFSKKTIKKSSEEKLIEKLHAKFQSGGSREEKIRAAEKIRDTSDLIPSEKRVWSLHRALDVIIINTYFEKSEYGSASHKRYWKTGSNIAKTIRQLNNGIGPNIPAMWYAETYDDAINEKSSGSRYDQK